MRIMKIVQFRFEIGETVYYASPEGIRTGEVLRAGYRLETDKLEYHVRYSGKAFSDNMLFKSEEDLRANLMLIKGEDKYKNNKE